MFGNDWAEAAEIDKNEKIETKRRIRERIKCRVKNRGQKAGCQCTKVQDGIHSAFLLFTFFRRRSRSPERSLPRRRISIFSGARGA